MVSKNEQKQALAKKSLGIILPLSIMLAGCSGVPATSVSTDVDVNGAAAQEEQVPEPLNSAFEMGTRIIDELPDECRLSDEEMKNAIEGYASFVRGQGGSLSVGFEPFLNDFTGESGETVTLEGSDGTFRSFNNIRECFAYLYECHQININGAITEFAQGNSYSHALEGATIVEGATNADEETVEDEEDNVEAEDDTQFSSGNAANFATADGVIGVNFPNASITGGADVAAIGVSVGGSTTTVVSSMTTDYQTPNGISVSGFGSKEARVRFNSDFDDATMSDVLSNVMILVPADNADSPVPVVWSVYNASGEVISSITSNIVYSRLAG